MAVEIKGKKNILSSVINLDVGTCYFTHFLVARRLNFPLIFVVKFTNAYPRLALRLEITK